MARFYSGVSVYRYRSTLDDTVEFKTGDEARAYDRERALELVSRSDAKALLAAMTSVRRPDLVKALMILAEEVSDVAFAPETPPCPADLPGAG